MAFPLRRALLDTALLGVIATCCYSIYTSPLGTGAPGDVEMAATTSETTTTGPAPTTAPETATVSDPHWFNDGDSARSDTPYWFNDETPAPTAPTGETDQVVDAPLRPGTGPRVDSPMDTPLTQTAQTEGADQESESFVGGIWDGLQDMARQAVTQ